MARPFFRTLPLLLLGAVSATAPAGQPDGPVARPAVVDSTLPKPPTLDARPIDETYFGTTVTDRFRFVEALDPATLDWMRTQGRDTRSVFDTIAPRAAILRRMDALGGGFGVVGSVKPVGDRLFFL